jgi:hypothetical protein
MAAACALSLPGAPLRASAQLFEQMQTFLDSSKALALTEAAVEDHAVENGREAEPSPHSLASFTRPNSCSCPCPCPCPCLTRRRPGEPPRAESPRERADPSQYRDRQGAGCPLLLPDANVVLAMARTRTQRAGPGRESRAGGAPRARGTMAANCVADEHR